MVSIWARDERTLARSGQPDKAERLKLLLDLCWARPGKLHLTQPLLLDFVDSAGPHWEAVIEAFMAPEEYLAELRTCLYVGDGHCKGNVWSSCVITSGSCDANTHWPIGRKNPLGL